MGCLTDEEKREVNELNSNIEKRKLQIQIDEWKCAFNKLETYVIKNISNLTLFEVKELIKQIKPNGRN